ncbi:MAG: PKD-like family lipoprotein [Candidatus Pseudobacter hemicellulosilyticus]|uniref:PKD-like family lipoprotein n=1 Tax=Candidatus Pseudobacter hemicellulosilyticus TaxID=3121375 RepID=A0AAJ5WMZ6_9BACT|nr:MAG: PKD-like family lipoprotein [Pseudobacter sp.]
MIGLWLAAGALLLSACFKDKGNYSYTTLNDVLISMPDTLLVKQGAQLEVNPVVSQLLNKEEDRLTYEWVVTVPGRTASDSTLEILATTRDLKVEINYQSGRYYPLNLKITDNASGIVYRKQSLMRVTTDFEPGYLLLENDGLTADLSFVNTGRDEILRQVFSTANPGITLPVSAHHVYVCDYPLYTASVGSTSWTNAPGTITAVFGSEEGYILDYRTMRVATPYSLFFTTPPAVVAPGHFQMDSEQPPVFLSINNGQLHRIYFARGQALLGDAYLAPDDKGYFLAPHCANTSSVSLYYDQRNKRFLTENYLNLYLAPVVKGGSSGFDPANVSGQLLGMGLGKDWGDFYAVFKDETGDDCYFYTFSFTNALKVDKISSSPGFANSPAILFSTLRDQVYYADGNKLYLYDIAANFSRVLYEFPAGENTSALMLQDGNTLVAATWDGAEGRLYKLGLDASGSVIGGAYQKKYTGFGKIIHLKYKK